MGGKNHQPCSIYLKNSTLVSRMLSLGYAELEHANVALEDIILAELEGGRGDAALLETHLNASLKALNAVSASCDALRNQMESAEYQDLPSLETVDLGKLGIQFAREGLVQEAHWTKITATMRQGGFYAVLHNIQSDVHSLALQTEALIRNMKTLRPAIQRGELAALTESNQPGNFRAEFFRTYTAWTRLNGEFVASSALSTELWYAFTRVGSLSSELRRDVSAA